MSNERRAPFTKSKMGGDMPDNQPPEQLYSTTFTKFQFYKLIAGLVLTMVSIFGVFLGTSYRFMVYTADRNFEHRVKESLKDDGAISKAIDVRVEASKHSLEIRLIRIETILLEMRDE